MLRARHDPHSAQAGFALVEVVAMVAILAVVAGFAFETLAQRGAQARSTAVAFAGLVAEARALAAVTGADKLDGGSGASIGVVRDGDVYVATLYAYRPVLGASQVPIRQPDTPPLRTLTALALRTAGGVAAPPFALFFAPSGHASAQPDFTVTVSAALATEPACPPETGIVVEFTAANQTAAHAISCELAQLELTPAPAPAR